MHPIDFQSKFVRRFKNPPDNEQVLIRSFFGGKSGGFFVDLGANDPVVGSQSLHLEHNGWNGLLIEPLPDYCLRLRQQRKGKVVECACSGPENHGNSLEIIVAGVHSTLNEKPVSDEAAGEGKISVLCRTLDSVLEEHQVSPGFEFLSIDIEGHEMEMFKGFDLRRWKPQLVLMEDHVLEHRKHNHMLSQGYRILLRTGINSWYVPQAAGYGMSVFARLQFFRKFWPGMFLRRLKSS
jgi:FkbM family methyltransferase